MAYRISLHLLSSIWHLLLLALALSLQRTHSKYRSLIPVCFFSAAYTLAWSLGLIFRSELGMRLTWVGALWPTALFICLRDTFDVPTSKGLRIAAWTLGSVNAIGGMTSLGLVRIVSYEPTVVATYGILEPLLRVMGIVQVIGVLSVAVTQFGSPAFREKLYMRFGLLGYCLYGVGAMLSAGILPLLNEYRWIESASYGSIVWSTFAVWIAFKDLEHHSRSLVELDQFKRDFINHVTHEFRTPLGAITGATEILEGLNGAASKKASEYLTMIRSNTTRVGRFVDDLLDLATIQQAKVTLHKTDVDLREIVDRVAKRLTPLAQQRHTHIAVSTASVMVACDEERMEQVIANLISNAIKAAPKGEIHIAIDATPPHAIVRVRDNGVGIARENLEKIFSSFYRVALKRGPEKGTGLGLAIAKGWVEAHGGRIWAESEGEGKGTTVTFTVPVG